MDYKKAHLFQELKPAELVHAPYIPVLITPKVYIESDEEREQRDQENKELDAEWEKTKFIKVKLEIDQEEAEKRYRYDYANNVDGCADCYLSYNQWLNCKEYEAIQFYMKISL